MKSAFALVVIFLFVTPVANAATEVTTSRLYLFNPDATDIKNSIDGLEAAIKTRGESRPSKQVGLIPSELPDKPGEPESRPVSFGPMTVNLLGCGNAYAKFDTGSSNTGGLGSTSEQFIGCVHLSKRGKPWRLVRHNRMGVAFLF